MVPLNSPASRLERHQFDRWMVRRLGGLIQRLRVSASMPKWKSTPSGLPQRSMLGWALFYLFSSAVASGIKVTPQRVCGWHQAEWCSCCIRGRGWHPEGSLRLDSLMDWQAWGMGSYKLYGINKVLLLGWDNPQSLWAGCSEKMWMLLHCLEVFKIRLRAGLDWTVFEYPF